MRSRRGNLSTSSSRVKPPILMGGLISFFSSLKTTVVLRSRKTCIFSSNFPSKLKFFFVFLVQGGKKTFFGLREGHVQLLKPEEG
jgi:hypothetical protein